MVREPLYVQTTTEIVGSGGAIVSGAWANASLTARRAGFGLRIMSVMPNFQFSTSAPPVCHSSVHEKTNAPAQPPENEALICQFSALDCASGPFLKLSRPISAMTSGL